MKYIIVGLLIASIQFLSSCKEKGEAAENRSSTLVDGKEREVLLPSANHPKGQKLYNDNCKSCHQRNGQGVLGVFPPLSKSDFLKNREATIKQVLHGSTGELIVNGVIYNGTMTPFNNLTDQEIVDVLTFVYHSWGNEIDSAITIQEVRQLR